MVRPADAGADRPHCRLLSGQERQLRRLDEWAALADVADAVLAADNVAHRGPVLIKTLGARSGLCSAWVVSDVDELFALEPLASSVDLPLDGRQRLDSVLR